MICVLKSLTTKHYLIISTAIIKMNNTITLHSHITWPQDLIEFLEEHHDLFVSWELKDTKAKVREISPHEYDEAIYALREVLKPYDLHGLHCTKLTKDEINQIRTHGMSLQNSHTLSNRIDNLVQAKIISKPIADRLKTENQADEEYRAKMLWFCFFEPHLAGEDGIERFFRSWGGEALYNSHEDDPETGAILKTIGIPCVIEASVPISAEGEHSYLATKIYRNFLKTKGFDIRECCDHEGYATSNIPKENILNIIEFPSTKFKEITKCDEWEEPL